MMEMKNQTKNEFQFEFAITKILFIVEIFRLSLCNVLRNHPDFIVFACDKFQSVSAIFIYQLFVYINIWFVYYFGTSFFGAAIFLFIDCVERWKILWHALNNTHSPLCRQNAMLQIQRKYNHNKHIISTETPDGFCIIAVVIEPID